MAILGGFTEKPTAHATRPLMPQIDAKTTVYSSDVVRNDQIQAFLVQLFAGVCQQVLALGCESDFEQITLNFTNDIGCLFQFEN